MSGKRGQWITRRGQAGVETAIDQVIDLHPQPGEHIQHVPDASVEDSPYQARQPFTDDSIEELTQAMREVGFQGILIVRPHSDGVQRRHGRYQLVYGHRRRMAWRRVCIERGEPCLLPVVVREVSDERMLTIGAQENLQRQDLDPIEEAQLVAWHQQMFSNKNQAEIGAMLGKSSDWVSVRARIHKLPDTLKERLRQRPRAISQMLELGTLFTEQSDAAVLLADRVVFENLTLEMVRNLVRGYIRPEHRRSQNREERHNRRGAATSVQNVTGERPDTGEGLESTPLTGGMVISDLSANRAAYNTPSSGSTTSQVADLARLQDIASTIANIAARADHLPIGATTEQVLEQLEQAVTMLRRAIVVRGHTLQTSAGDRCSLGGE